ncbi:MAG: PAS domain S-box protein, partial [Candidatus Hodarchaeales archaeon]
LNLSQMRHASIEEITNYALEESIKLTNSKVGFVGGMDEDESEMTLYAWSEDTMKECVVSDYLLHFPVSDAGIWADTIRMKKPVIINDYNQPHFHKKGTPEGHVELSRFVSVPLVSNYKVVAVLGIGNKPTDYNETDIRQLSLLLEGTWRHIQSQEADLALRESDERLRSVFSSLSDLIFVLDKYGTILDCQRPEGAEDYYKQSENFIGQHYKELFPTNVTKLFDDSIEALKMIGGVQRFDYSLIMENKISWFSASLSLRRDNYGKYAGVTAVVRDITNRKKIENDLRESEEKYRDLIENLNDVIYSVDNRGVITYISPPIELITGFKPSEIIGKPIFEFIHPEDRKFSLELFNRQPSDIIQMSEYRILTKTGETRWIRSSAKKILEDGVFVGLQGISTDITKRKHSELALLESEQKFRTLAESAMVGVLIIQDDKVVYVNEAATKNFGFSRELVKKFTISDLFNYVHPEDRLIAANWRNIIHNSFRVKDGTKKIQWIEVYTKTINYGGKTADMVATIDITDRKNMEEALRESEQKYRELVEKLRDGLGVMDTKGIITFVNPRIAEMLGYKEEEMLDRHWSDFIIQEERNKVDEERTRLSEGHGFSYETILLTKDGKSVPVIINATPLFTFYETFSGVLALITDITERKRVEDALRESDLKYRSFVQNFQGIAFRASLDNWTPVFFHGAVEEITGYAEDEFLAGKPRWDEVIHPQDLIEIRNDTEKMRTTPNYSIEREYRIICKDGQIKWVIDIIQNICDEHGKLTVVQGVIYDITNRKKADVALRESERRYRTLFEQSPFSLWEEDFTEIKVYLDDLRESGINNYRQYFDNNPEAVKKCVAMVKINDVNKSTINIFKAKDKNDLVSNLNNVFNEESYPVFKEELIALAEGKTIIELEGRNKTLTGENIDVFIRCSVISGYEESLSKVLVSLMDITKLKKAEELIIKQQEESELLLSILTHDLNNFHLAAREFLGFAMMEPISPDTKELLEQARQSVLRSIALIRNVSIMIKGKLPWTLSLHPVNLLKYVNNSKLVLEELFPERTIELKIVGFDQDCQIMADSLFEQLLLNLLTYSVRNDSHELVKLDIKMERSMVGKCLLTITDHARGIPNEKRDGIFQRYKTFRKEDTGSNFGMFIVKALVDRYQGKIWIESRVPEDYTKGTKFFIELSCP